MQQRPPPGPPQPPSFLRKNIVPILFFPIFITSLFGWYKLQRVPGFEGPQAEGRLKNVQLFGYTVVDRVAEEKKDTTFDNVDLAEDNKE